MDRTVFGAFDVPLEVCGWEPKVYDSVFEGEDTEELLDRFCGWGSDEKIVHRNGNTDLGLSSGLREKARVYRGLLVTVSCNVFGKGGEVDVGSGGTVEVALESGSMVGVVREPSKRGIWRMKTWCCAGYFS